MSQCIGRELNPGLVLGRHQCYRYTTNARKGIGLIASGALALVYICAPFANFVADKVGTRKCLMLGSFFGPLVLALTGVYANFCHPRHVLINSLLTCGYPLGTFILNPVLEILIRNFGWQKTFGIHGLILFLLCFPFSLGVVDPDQLEDKAGERDETIPLIRPAEEGQLKKKTRIIVGMCWFFATCLRSVGYSGSIMFLVHYMTSLGVSPEKASIGMSVMGICEGLSRLIFSLFGDNLKGHLIFSYTVASLLLSLTNCFAIFTYNFPTVLIYIIALGLFDGPIMAAQISASIELHDGRHLSETFSIFRISMGIGSFIGPTLAGALFDLTHSFHSLFYLGCGSYFFCSIFYVTCLLLRKFKKSWWENEYVQFSIDKQQPE
ncbi:DgyrCDS3679 [Dimorphilus gyrociliatus]|uniref:DgyrCDS3679 n=1 Tax=Dimorphilus gyrociliatus TaxID=2664684 RepID=A0A7I8VH36_9ANNE|nr:DgyrCDS3679 [Dimorphilus gyrociliatus]